MPLLPQFGPLQDPSIGQLEALSVDDTMTGEERVECPVF
jgi:hypothetical protein